MEIVAEHKMEDIITLNLVYIIFIMLAVAVAVQLVEVEEEILLEQVVVAAQEGLD